MVAPNVSVVIPSYNQEKTVKACLDSVLNQKTKLKYEVIVVDSSSNKTSEILKSYVPRIRLVRRKTRTYCGEARNIGIRKARGNIIAFTDTDCMVDKNWINNIHRTHKKYNAVGGRILNGNPKNLIGWGIFLPQFVEFAGDQNKKAGHVPGCNLSFKKEIFKRYGYFADTPFLNEDTLFNLAIREKIYFSKDIIIRHINKTNLFRVIKYSFGLGRGAAFTRQQTKVAGSFLLKYKILIPGLFFYRFCKIGHLSIGARCFSIFLLTSPLIFINLTILLRSL